MSFYSQFFVWKYFIVRLFLTLLLVLSIVNNVHRGKIEITAVHFYYNRINILKI